MRSPESPYEVIVEGRLAQGALQHVWQSRCSDEFDLVLICASEIEILPEGNKIVIPFADSTDGVPDSIVHMLNAILYDAAFYDMNVLTICHMGENRSGFASAIYLMQNAILRGDFSYSAEDAISLIREKVSPLTDNPYTLWNEGFVKQLKEMDNG